jgi:hypothetical protein
MDMKLNKEIEFDIQECITDLKSHGDPERARQQKR